MNIVFVFERISEQMRTNRMQRIDHPNKKLLLGRYENVEFRMFVIYSDELLIDGKWRTIRRNGISQMI